MKQDITYLIEELRQGKPTACQRLLTEYGPAVFRMVQRIVVHREDAEEVYQDVFVKALGHIDSFNPKQASLSTWLGRIAYNESLNFIRGKKPDIVYIDDYESSVEKIGDMTDVDILDEQTVKHLEKAMEILPPYEQSLIAMFYYDDMSIADIAYVTGSIPSTIGSQLCRIRKKLYRIIKTL